MKKTLSKVLCIFLIIITLFNFVYPKKSYAVDGWDVIGGLADGVTGILIMPAKLILITVGTISGAVASQIAEVDAGKNENGNSEKVWFLSLEDIFFHNVDGKLPILNVNFFKPISSGHEVISGIRNNISGWYSAIRNLAIIISLLVLIYIGIRMAISTLAEDKATYKKMLTDWIVGFITIFLLHYIIVATVYINEALVTALRPANGGSWFSDYMNKILVASLNTISFTQGMAGAIVYTFMAVLTFMFLFTYIKRMLTVAFLIIIAPIITVTYSIDKIGDGKSQALNTWLKEFIYNILIQPFHCIIYLVFASILSTLLNADKMISLDGFFTGTTIGGGVIAIVILIFMRQAEDIVRNIFGFNNAKSLGSAVAAGVLLKQSMDTAGKALEKVGKKASSSGGSSSGSGGSKSKTSPAVKDTSNVGNSKNSSSRNSSSNSNRQGSSNSSNQQSSQGSSSQGQSTRTNNSRSTADSGSAEKPREYNTNIEEAQSNFNKALDLAAKANVKALQVASGIAIGGALSGDVTGMVTAYNFAKAGTTAVNAEGVIRHPIKGAKSLANKTPIVARNWRITSKTNDVIDSYNNLRSAKGWSNDKMLTETERLLDIKDTSRIKDDKLRDYAENVQNLREEYEGKYQVPNDMVLDRITKIQSGEVKKNDSFIYKKKPKTRPIDRGRGKNNK